MRRTTERLSSLGSFLATRHCTTNTLLTHSAKSEHILNAARCPGASLSVKTMHSSNLSAMRAHCSLLRLVPRAATAEAHPYSRRRRQSLAPSTMTDLCELEGTVSRPYTTCLLSKFSGYLYLGC